MYRISNGVRSANSEDGAIVLDLRQGHMFHLNPAGSRILELLRSGCAESEIVDEISQQFAIARDVAETDVGEFLQELTTHQLIEEHSVDEKS